MHIVHLTERHLKKYWCFIEAAVDRSGRHCSLATLAPNTSSVSRGLGRRRALVLVPSRSMWVLPLNFLLDLLIPCFPSPSFAVSLIAMGVFPSALISSARCNSDSDITLMSHDALASNRAQAKNIYFFLLKKRLLFQLCTHKSINQKRSKLSRRYKVAITSQARDKTK